MQYVNHKSAVGALATNAVHVANKSSCWYTGPARRTKQEEVGTPGGWRSGVKSAVFGFKCG
jgi:hypothetical protein